MRWITLGTLFAVLASAGHALSLAPNVPDPREQPHPIGRAVQAYRAYLDAHPDSIEALRALGSIYLNAYLMGNDAVYVTLPEGDEPTKFMGSGMLPIPCAKRLKAVPATRARYLAEAITVYRHATEIAPEQVEIWLGLGNALHEARDRFTQTEWPLNANAFDKEAKERGADPAYWEDAALAALRKVGVSKEPKSEWDVYNISPTQDAARLIVEILRTKPGLSDEEKAELETRKAEAEAAQKHRDMNFGLNEETLTPLPPELAALYPLSPKGLATAQLYFRALDATLFYAPKFDELPLVGGNADRQNPGLTANHLPLTKEFLACNAEAYRLLHEAAQSNECRYPVDLTQGAAMQLPHAARLRHLGRMLGLKAEYAALVGDPAAATAAIVDGIALAQSLRKEPILISQLVRVALVGIMANSLQQVLDTTALSTSQLSTLEKAFARVNGVEDYVNAMRMESINARKLLKEYLATPEDESPATDDLPRFPRSAIPPNAPEAQQKSYEEAIAMADLPYAEAKSKLDALAAGQLGPPLGRSLIAILRANALSTTIQTLLAVNRYWLTHSAPPEQLDDLVPEFLPALPLDPFTDEPPRYRIEGEGVRVYSIGDDGVDDGGAKTNKETRRPADFSFTLGIAPPSEGEGTP